MLAALVVVIAVLVPYVEALGGTLVWDDRLLILDAPMVEHGGRLSEFFARPLWAGEGAQPVSASYYRPLVTLSLAVDHRLHGTNAGGLHLTNVALHLGAALALLWLLRRSGIGAVTATGLAAGFALLPRLAEAAAWISGRADLFAGLFSILALAVWGAGPARRVAAAVLVLGGLLSKESALAAPLALGVAEWVAERGVPLRARLRLLVPRLAPLAAAVVCYLGLRLAVVGVHDEGTRLGALLRLRVVLEALGTYAWMLLDPFQPRAVIGRIGAVSVLGTVMGLVVLAALAVGLARLWSRIGRTEALGLSLAGFALLPVLHVIPIPLRTLAADRFLYLPAAGLALSLAPGVERLFRARRLARGLGVALLVALFVTTLLRVRVWSNEIAFWVETYLETPPVNNAAAVELAGLQFRAGRFRDALALSKRALDYDDPHRHDAQYNAALCLARLGHYDQALHWLLASDGGRVTPKDALLVAVFQIQAGKIENAKQSLTDLAARGDGGARYLLQRLPELVSARDELRRLGKDGDPERRARLAAELGDQAVATPAWAAVTVSPGVTRATLEEGLAYLVQTGERAAIERAARALMERFGGMDPVLEDIVQVRLAELRELDAAAPRLGLARGPAS